MTRSDLFTSQLIFSSSPRSSYSYSLLPDLPQATPALQLPFRNLARATVSLPLLALVFSIFWALWTDMEAATATHCGVSNYLPSLSAAMGNFKLAEAVWRICIALHAAPRLLVSFMYYTYLRTLIRYRHVVWARVACVLNLLENCGLIGLSFVSSTDHYSVHEKCFLLFILASELYMVALCALMSTVQSELNATKMQRLSFRMKRRLLMANVASFALAAYAFLRHNNYCEPGMYTVFAFFEYVVVLTNMGFHMTAFWDFHDKILVISPAAFHSKSI